MARQPVDPAGPGRLPVIEVGATRRAALDAYAAGRGVPLAEAVRELLDRGLDTTVTDQGQREAARHAQEER